MPRGQMAFFPPVLLLLALIAPSSPASEPARAVESVLPALRYGPACWSSLDLHNLGDRAVIVQVEAHRSSGALVALVDHPGVIFTLNDNSAVAEVEIGRAHV